MSFSNNNWIPMYGDTDSMMFSMAKNKFDLKKVETSEGEKVGLAITLKNILFPPRIIRFLNFILLDKLKKKRNKFILKILNNLDFNYKLQISNFLGINIYYSQLIIYKCVKSYLIDLKRKKDKSKKKFIFNTKELKLQFKNKFLIPFDPDIKFGKIGTDPINNDHFFKLGFDYKPYDEKKQKNKRNSYFKLDLDSEGMKKMEQFDREFVNYLSKKENRDSIFRKI